MPRKPITWDDVRRLALGLDGTVESTSYGTPALKAGRKLYARLHQDGADVVVRMTHSERERWMGAKPAAFHVTDHYAGHPYVLVRLAAVSEADLATVLAAGWAEARS